MESEEHSVSDSRWLCGWPEMSMSNTFTSQPDLRDDTGDDSKLPLDASAPSSSASSPMVDTEAEAEAVAVVVMHNFECSHQLDENSLRALRHDDEDQVHRANTASYLTKQLQRQEAMKNFKSGEPCMVCGDAASGIHYSVWSCNGCKTFFRRCVIENRTYSCKRNGDCAIDKSQRCACRHCRFRKCLQVGMDCTELNTDRRRKRRTLEAGNSSLYTDPVGIEDPLVRELLQKEHQFLKILTSTVAPIHSGVKEALIQSSFFSDYDASECTQMKRGDQMNFSYWRAKILSTVIEWAKSFDEFYSLAPQDQEAMLVHAAFSNLVLSEAFHTPERYTDRIVFPDGLSGFRNLTANILKERSGLIPTVVAVINNILVPIRKIGMNEVEYVLLQAIIFFDPECLSLSESAVEVVATKRSALLDSLRKNLEARLPENKMDSSYRLAALLLRISNVHKVAAFKRETLCTIETFNLMSPHPLTMEICKKYPDISFF